MTEPTALIVPPLGGKRGYVASDRSRVLTQALSQMTQERDDAEAREIALHRLAVAALSQAFGGTVTVKAELLSDDLPLIRTEYDSQTRETRIWLDPTPEQD